VVDLFIGFSPARQGVAVLALLGGSGHLPGAMLGRILIGLIEAYGPGILGE